MLRNQKLGYTPTLSKLAKLVTIMNFIKELHQFYKRIMYFTEKLVYVFLIKLLKEQLIVKRKLNTSRKKNKYLNLI